MANALFISLATAQEYHNISDFATFINNIFTILLSLGAIFATLRTVYGHYLYMRSDKSSDELSRAKSIVGDAVVGLILLFGIYIVLFNINPILIKNNDQLILFNFDSLFKFD